MWPALLFGVFGLVFLMTSAKLRVRKVMLYSFGLSVTIHILGFTLKSWHPLIADLVRINSLVLLVLVLSMSAMIYFKYGRPRQVGNAGR